MPGEFVGALETRLQLGKDLLFDALALRTSRREEEVEPHLLRDVRPSTGRRRKEKETADEHG